MLLKIHTQESLLTCVYRVSIRPDVVIEVGRTEGVDRGGAQADDEHPADEDAQRPHLRGDRLAVEAEL